MFGLLFCSLRLKLSFFVKFWNFFFCMKIFKSISQIFLPSIAFIHTQITLLFTSSVSLPLSNVEANFILSSCQHGFYGNLFVLLPHSVCEYSEKCTTPPTTPLDELALKRHRFFADLIDAAHAAIEHRVRFDPLGPTVNEVIVDNSETNQNCKLNINCCMLVNHTEVLRMALSTGNISICQPLLI